MLKSDVLIVGSGIAGLSLAIHLAERDSKLKIAVLTKTQETESNTKYAQGGIAAVWDTEHDSAENHFEDTLIAGDGLGNQNIINIVVNEGPQRVEQIINWGARFDKNQNSTYDLAMEGGHSKHRILHYKDITGWEMLRVLIEKAATFPNIRILEHYFALDIITQHHFGYVVTKATPDLQAFGVYALNKQSGKIETLSARFTVIATGGVGQGYKATTNPVVATGDGIAMAYRAKGSIENMEFVQFHPTSLYNPNGENPAFLISEAVRGFGAILKTKDGETFMEKYDERLSLAPRDIVARAIDNELKTRGEEYVCLDCTHLDPIGFETHFPNILQKCLSIGIHPMRQMIPVVPAAHYCCGGIKVDEFGKTDISSLYAVGECSYTGLHGANRLASNSLLEALVFSKRISSDILGKLGTVGFVNHIPNWNAKGTTDPKEMVLITQDIKELKEIMSYYVGIVRNDVRLKRAMERLHILYSETEDLYMKTIISPQLCELRNLITIAYLITKSASLRKESRGLHYTTDYPSKLPFLDNIVL